MSIGFLSVLTPAIRRSIVRYSIDALALLTVQLTEHGLKASNARCSGAPAQPTAPKDPAQEINSTQIHQFAKDLYPQALTIVPRSLRSADCHRNDKYGGRQVNRRGRSGVPLSEPCSSENICHVDSRRLSTPGYQT